MSENPPSVSSSNPEGSSKGRGGGRGGGGRGGGGGGRGRGGRGGRFPDEGKGDEGQEFGSQDATNEPTSTKSGSKKEAFGKSKGKTRVYGEERRYEKKTEGQVNNNDESVINSQESPAAAPSIVTEASKDSINPDDKKIYSKDTIPKEPQKKTRKVIIRKLPANKNYTSIEFEKHLHHVLERLALPETHFRIDHFTEGKLSRKRGPVFSTGYVTISEEDSFQKFVEQCPWKCPFLNDPGDEENLNIQPEIGLAPYGKSFRLKDRNDKYVNTYENDPEFLQFKQQLENPKSADAPSSSSAVAPGGVATAAVLATAPPSSSSSSSVAAAAAPITLEEKLKTNSLLNYLREKANKKLQLLSNPIHLLSLSKKERKKLTKDEKKALKKLKKKEKKKNMKLLLKAAKKGGGGGGAAVGSVGGGGDDLPLHSTTMVYQPSSAGDLSAPPVATAIISNSSSSSSAAITTASSSSSSKKNKKKNKDRVTNVEGSSSLMTHQSNYHQEGSVEDKKFYPSDSPMANSIFGAATAGGGGGGGKGPKKISILKKEKGPPAAPPAPSVSSSVLTVNAAPFEPPLSSVLAPPLPPAPPALYDNPYAGASEPINLTTTPSGLIGIGLNPFSSVFNPSTLSTTSSAVDISAGNDQLSMNLEDYGVASGVDGYGLVGGGGEYYYDPNAMEYYDDGQGGGGYGQGYPVTAPSQQQSAGGGGRGGGGGGRYRGGGRGGYYRNKGGGGGGGGFRGKGGNY